MWANGTPTWSQFLRAHVRAVLACDFLTVDSVRLGVLYVLVFLEIGSRRVVFCNATAHPDSAWVAQQARNLAWELEELKVPIKVLIRDRDTKYSSDFDAVFSAPASGSPEPHSGARGRTPPASGYWARCGQSVWTG